MLASTEDYLARMRQGDYLAVLHWMTFIKAHYTQDASKHSEPLNADTLLLLAVYELVHHGFSIDDEESLVIILALLSQSPPILKEDLAYGAMLLFNAGIQYLVYVQQNTLSFYQHAEVLRDSESIIAWMSRENVLLTDQVNSKNLAIKMAELTQLIPQYQSAINRIINKISPVIAYSDICNSYTLSLIEFNKKKRDENASLRLGIALALYDYLLTQEQINSTMMVSITSYVDQLRVLEPEPWEENFFSSLSPKTLCQKFLAGSRQWFNFFAENAWNELMIQPSDDNLDHNEDSNPTPSNNEPGGGIK